MRVILQKRQKGVSYNKLENAKNGQDRAVLTTLQTS